MNKGIFALIGGVVILGGAGLLGQLGGGEADADGGTEPVAVVEDVRPVVLPGTCPVASKEAASCVAVVQMDPDRCLCLTSQKPGTVDGELTDPATLPAGSKRRLVVCEKTGKVSVRWEADSGAVDLSCVVAARPLVDVTMGDAETDLVVQLRAACAPCPVSGTSWTYCPGCLLTEGGCAAACAPPGGGASASPP